MDVDPKSVDQSPAAPAEPEIPVANEQPTFDSPKPMTNTQSPVIAAALNEEVLQDKEPQTQSAPVVNPVEAVKKSYRGLIGGIIIGVILIITGLAWYVFYGTSISKPSTSNTTTTSTQNTITPATSDTNGSVITTAVDSLSANATNEASLSGTDDSSSATDASQTAGSVGDSVNENNF